MIFNEDTLIEKLFEFNVDKEAYQMTEDRKGALNVIYTSRGKSNLLHSGYNAEKEGRDFAEKNYKPGCDIAVFGMGIGYHIRALAEKMESERTLYVFETNISVIKLALNYTDIGKVLKRDNVVFYWAEGLNKLENKFFECMRKGASQVLYFPALITVPEDHTLLMNFTKRWHFLKTCKISAGDIQEIKSYFNVSPVPRKKRYKVTVIGDEKSHIIFDSSAKNFMLAFSCIGCDTNYISKDTLEKELDAQTTETLASSDFYIAFHPEIIEWKKRGALSSPLFTIGMDRPYAIHAGEITREKEVICTWHDRYDLRYAGMYHTGALHRFLTVPAEIDFELRELFNKKRNFDVVIINSIVGGMGLFNLHCAIQIPDVREIMEALLYYFRNAKGTKLMEECCLEVLGRNALDDALIALLMSTGMPVDLQVRHEKRYSVVKALLEAGIKLNLFGADWDLTDIVSYPNCIYYGGISADTGRKFMEDCKILVNTMPSYGMDAGHDRILSAMMRGALCITDPTDYLREEFVENEEIVFYDPFDLSALAQKVNYYLRNEEERLRIAKKGHEKVKARHTFINRAEEILDMFEEYEGNRNG
jgi:glycosyltransferase involved in cell wall biosynthesis